MYTLKFTDKLSAMKSDYVVVRSLNTEEATLKEALLALLP